MEFVCQNSSPTVSDGQTYEQREIDAANSFMELSNQTIPISLNDGQTYGQREIEAANCLVQLCNNSRKTSNQTITISLIDGQSYGQPEIEAANCLVEIKRKWRRISNQPALEQNSGLNHHFETFDVTKNVPAVDNSTTSLPSTNKEIVPASKPVLNTTRKRNADTTRISDANKMLLRKTPSRVKRMKLQTRTNMVLRSRLNNRNGKTKASKIRF